MIVNHVTELRDSNNSSEKAFALSKDCEQCRQTGQHWGCITTAGFLSSEVLQMQSSTPHLFFGCHIPNIVVFGKMCLDNPEAGVPHALAHCFSEVS